MNQALNTAWIGFGWGQDVRVDGGALSDVYTFTVHRARPGGGSVAWTGSPDPDGTLRVRIDGTDTATWTAGVLPVSIRIQRGAASGIVADLPPLVVKMPAVPADGSEPLISDRGKPLALQLIGSDGGQIAVRLEAGIKGDKGDRGDTGDLTPDLVVARDLAIASANSSSADALATSADRAATAQDRAQVRTDQIAVADDRSRTAADRVATAADRVQVTQDFFAVAGLRAETETLRDSASGHRAAAQAAATASQGNRDATAADRLQTGQDRASTTASAAAAADDATQTAADRVQTGQDRAATAESAAAAATFDPALFVKRDGSQQMTGPLVLAPGSTTRAPFRLPPGSSPNTASNGDIWTLANAIYVFIGGATAEFFHTGNAPDATDAEADEGSGGARRMWSPARLWRAVRVALPLVSESVAEAGTDTVARSWSVQRVWQAIRAALPLFTQAQAEAGTVATPGAWSPQRDAQAIAALSSRGSSVTGVSDTVTVGTTDTPLAAADFVATGPSVFAFLNAHMAGAGTKFGYIRIDIYRLSDGALIKTGGTVANLHTDNSWERITCATEFTGLVRGVSYRLRGWGYTNGGTIPMSSFITGFCA